MHTLDTLKPKQLHFIEHLYSGMEVEGIDIQTCTSFSRSWLKYMASKYLDMEWAPAWIVKDTSRVSKRGVYHVPELTDFIETLDVEDVENATSEVVAAA